MNLSFASSTSSSSSSTSFPNSFMDPVTLVRLHDIPNDVSAHDQIAQSVIYSPNVYLFMNLVWHVPFRHST